MLNTSFPRLPGDIGNAASFNYPVIYNHVAKATPHTVVTDDELPESLKSAFVQAANQLLNANVSLITTSCGFLSIIQRQLASHCRVPVVTSTLTLLPLLAEIHGGMNRLGILTYDRQSLSERHSQQLSSHTIIEGLNTSSNLYQTISNDLPDLDRENAVQEVFILADKLLARDTGLRAIVLECTNLSPYKQELRGHTGLPVYDIVDAVHWVMESLP